MTDKLSTLLDDLLSPEALASLTQKRAAKAKTDLSDLLPPKPEPPKLELLPATSVLFHVQENTCSRCGGITILPLGLVAMHQLVRNGRRTHTMMGIPLTSANEHADLPRERDVVRTQSMVCAVCVDIARNDPQPKAIPSPFPFMRPGTQEWFERYHGCSFPQDVEEYRLRIAREDERLARELEDADPLQPIVSLSEQLNKENEE